MAFVFGHTSEGRFSGGFVFTVVAKIIKVSNRCENMDLSVPPKHDFISLSFDFSWVLRSHLTTMIQFFWIHLWKNMIVRLVWNGPSLVFVLEWPLHSGSIQWIRRHSDNFVDLHEYFKGHFNRNNWPPLYYCESIQKAHREALFSIETDINSYITRLWLPHARSIHCEHHNEPPTLLPPILTKQCLFVLLRHISRHRETGRIEGGKRKSEEREWQRGEDGTWRRAERRAKMLHNNL